jgi:hypothetical protein
MTETVTAQLSQADAERVIESLRQGVPPAGFVRTFTVGRRRELTELEATLALPTGQRGAARLIRANYGSGKSHLLQVIREMALQAGYATALVTMDAENGVRGNRMDQVLGAICRALEVPGARGRSVAPLFDAFRLATAPGEAAWIRERISDGGDWSISEHLRSPAVFVALRAWVTSSAHEQRELVADWLSYPDVYEKGHKKDLYWDLVAFSGRPFRDPRPEWEFYDGVFKFRAQSYQQSWSALRDLDTVAKAAGFKGLVLLVDEFEDVIQNLNNRAWQQSAFASLFRFFKGESFPGMAYFAVTPEFSHKCKSELMSRQVYDFPTHLFDSLEYFEMSPVSERDLQELARRIRAVHAAAYGTDDRDELKDAQLDLLVRRLARRSSQDQTRQAIEGIVSALDQALE